MKLTYRGIKYQEERSTLPVVVNKDLIYRGHSTKAKINPKFPWLGYIKQLFFKPESKPVFDPITFWYGHKRRFIEHCWHIEDIEQLNLAWNLTRQIEQAKAVKPKPIKLKYRGVTYHR